MDDDDDDGDRMMMMLTMSDRRVQTGRAAVTTFARQPHLRSPGLRASRRGRRAPARIRECRCRCRYQPADWCPPRRSWATLDFLRRRCSRSRAVVTYDAVSAWPVTRRPPSDLNTWTSFCCRHRGRQRSAHRSAKKFQRCYNSGPRKSFKQHSSSAPPLPFPLLPFPFYYTFPLFFPFLPFPLCQGTQPLPKAARGSWSAVSSPSGVWGEAPAEKTIRCIHVYIFEPKRAALVATVLWIFVYLLLSICPVKTQHSSVFH